MRAQGSPKPLGRAFAEPEFKFVEQHYQKPRLRYHDISMGKARAGELLAAFELIELDYSGFGEVTPVNRSMSRCNSFSFIETSTPGNSFHHLTVFILVFLYFARLFANDVAVKSLLLTGRVRLK